MKATVFAVSLSLVFTGSVFAQSYADDNFNGTTLGPQWTWSPGATADTTTSSYVLDNGRLIMQSARGADRSWDVDNGAYVEQPQPTDAEWAVTAHLIDFNPALGGYGADSTLGGYRWTKAAFELIADNNHWLSLQLTSIENGTGMNFYGQVQLDPQSATGKTEFKNEFRLENVGPNPDVYLRINKTRDGYYGEGSFDETSWFPLTPLIRNPETADGTLNGKLRLLAATAPVNAANTEKYPVPVQWESIYKTVLNTTSAPFAPDEFDGTSTADWHFQMGNPVDPFNPTPNWLFNTTSGTLDLTPGAHTTAGGSDISQSVTNQYGESGLIAWQNAPAAENFAVYTRVTPDVFLSASRYRAHGIRVWQNQNSWAGIKVLKNGNAPGNSGSRNYLEAMFESDNNTTRGVHAAYTSPDATTPGPQYLRVDKRSSNFRISYKFNEADEWIPAFTNQYPDGWFTVNIGATPGQDLKVELFAARPATTNGIGTITPSAFDFVRTIDISNVGDWQLY